MKIILQISLLSFLFLLATFISCTNQNQQKAFANDNDSEKENLIILESGKLYKSDTVVYPITTQLLKEKQGYISDDSFWLGKRGGNAYFTRNIMFFDTKSGNQQWLLKNNRSVISKMEPFMYSGVLRKGDTVKRQLNYLLFEIVSDDFNSDEKIDLNDTKVLYRTDLFGGNLTPITPTNFDVTKWDYLDYKENIIQVYGRYDSNNDFEYKTVDDHNTVFIIDLDKPEEKKNVFSASVRGEVKAP